MKKLRLKIVHEFRNENELYGYFLSSNKNTFIEVFKTIKKLILKIKIIILNFICFEVSDIKKFNKKTFNNKYKIKRGNWQNSSIFYKDLERNIIEFHQRDKFSKF